MKYKYQVMINIVILLLEACFIICFIEIDKMNDLSEHLVYIEFQDELNKKYEELIRFCNENQEEIEHISEEFSSIMEADMPYEEYIELKNKITNPDWKRISQTLNFKYDADRPWFVEYYCDELSWKISKYIFKVFYIVEEKAVTDAYMNNIYYGHDRFQKINDNLYVCIEFIGYT